MASLLESLLVYLVSLRKIRKKPRIHIIVYDFVNLFYTNRRFNNVVSYATIPRQ